MNSAAETSSSQTRGRKRPQLEAPTYFPDQLLLPKSSKRQKRDKAELNTSFNQEQSVWKSICHAKTTVWNFFFGKPKDSNMEGRKEINPFAAPKDGKALKVPSKDLSKDLSKESGDDEEEVKYLGDQDIYEVEKEEREVLVLAEYDKKKKHSSDKGSLFASRGLQTTNRAKKDRERLDGSRSVILKRLKDRHPSTVNWTKNFGGGGGGSRQSSNSVFSSGKSKKVMSSPFSTIRSIGVVHRRRQLGVEDCVRMDELERYQKLVQFNTPVFSEGVHKPSRGLKDVGVSPFFPRRAVGSYGAVSRGELSLQTCQATNLYKERLMGRAKGEQEVVGLEKEERSKPALVGATSSTSSDCDIIEIINKYSPPVSPTQERSESSSVSKQSTLTSELRLNPYFDEDFLTELKNKYDVSHRERERKIRETKVKKEHYSEISRQLEKSVEERLRNHLKITDVALEDDRDEEEGLPPITSEMEEKIKKASNSRPGVTLVDDFSISIGRHDIDTLQGLNWLNDEIINFYLNMICRRSKENDNWPTVYAFNTFFYQKIMQGGHSVVKRWTRKVDLFSYDLLLIPVHLGLHWCLATVDFSVPGVYYYDSMGGNNTKCLSAILQYLVDEHKHKKGSDYDVSEFKRELVKDIPQQMNGSDCGMFACKFAEYLSRRAKITFGQEDMPYFRRRMIYEITQNTLLHP